jgi:IS30 family transposase
MSRELRRTGVNRSVYSLSQAQVDRNNKAALKGRKQKLIKESDLLQGSWDDHSITLVSRTSWIKALRHKKKKRNSRKGEVSKRGKIVGGVSIHDRPKHVEKREEGGHSEEDLIIGKDHAPAMATIVERKS